MFLNLRRMGTAKTMIVSQLYKITKAQLEEVLEDYPSIRQDLIRQAKEKNVELIFNRKKTIEKHFVLKGVQKKMLM